MHKVLWLATILIILLCGCGGSTGSTDTSIMILANPDSVTVTAGSSASFRVVASGSNLNYQWYKDGSPVTGATKSVYTVASLSSDDIGTYYVVIASTSTSVTSTNATLSESPSVSAPEITTQPSEVEVASGSCALLTVVASGANLKYQWYKDGSAISGETYATLCIKSASTSSEGSYYVIVKNTAGSVQSDSAALTIGTSGEKTPAITTQPSSVTVTEESAASLTVVATGGNLTYQWYKGSTAIDGATSAKYSISSAASSDAGTYYVVVENTKGSVTSNSVTVTVNAQTAPSITTQPTAATVTVGSAASFTVVASGDNLKYQWYKDSALISGATSATYSISAAATTDAGSYYVIVSNSAGSVTSNTVTLTVNTITAPTITTQPSSTVVTVGSSASMSVVASGSSLKYQWYRNGSAVSGATSATYTVSSAATTNIGFYYVTVTNGGGTVTSNIVTLRVKDSYGIWGLYELSTDTDALSSISYSASSTNESAIWVTDSGTLSLTSPTLSSSGATTSNDYSSFYGLNAVLLATNGATITMNGGTITSSGTGANGVFSTGTNSVINISDATISCTGSGGHGIDATVTGTINATNLTASTTGANGSVIATDRGGGTINVTGGNYTCSGTDSAGIYSTGAITASGATISSTNGEAIVVEGANSVLGTDCIFSGAKGTRDRGVLIYNSTSGDAEAGTSYLTLTGGSYTWSSTSGPMFYITNTTGVISLEGVTLSNSSGTLIKAAADSWGTSGSNGGLVTVSTKGQAMTGNIVADTISTIALSMSSSSSLNGAVNTANTAKSISLTLDSTSTWTVTADSYLTILSDSAGISGTSITNIIGNGYTVYYDSASNSSLGGKTYTLSGGGYLKPK